MGPGEEGDGGVGPDPALPRGCGRIESRPEQGSLRRPAEVQAWLLGRFSVHMSPESQTRLGGTERDLPPGGQNG